MSREDAPLRRFRGLFQALAAAEMFAARMVRSIIKEDIDEAEEEYEPVRLANGKWACNHKCKDKSRFENPFQALAAAEMFAARMVRSIIKEVVDFQTLIYPCT
jgi:hypothetical protein